MCRVKIAKDLVYTAILTDLKCASIEREIQRFLVPYDRNSEKKTKNLSIRARLEVRTKYDLVKLQFNRALVHPQNNNMNGNDNENPPSWQSNASDLPAYSDNGGNVS